ncbi:MAG TPA: chemotaxis protein CheW [Bryobacteraceae bacterium]|nr:chemotaxis protein CheW [Bryobacteraceae bacterium]
MSGTTPGLAVIVRAGTLTCALPVSQVVETMRPLPVEPLANAPRFVRGLAIIRGAPVPVVDLGALLGANTDCPPARFVTVCAAERRVALAVDEILGVRDLEPFSISALPPLLREARCEIIEALGSLDVELLLVLKAGGVIPPDVWDTIDHRENTV